MKKRDVPDEGLLGCLFFIVVMVLFGYVMSFNEPPSRDVEPIWYTIINGVGKAWRGE